MEKSSNAKDNEDSTTIDTKKHQIELDENISNKDEIKNDLEGEGEEDDEDDGDDENDEEVETPNSKPSGKITKIINGKRLWTFSEDEKLKELVNLKGPRDWPWISSQMSGRTAKQCSKRWNYKLSPAIRHEKKWVQEEDDIIVSMQSKIGNRWTSISKLLHGRSDLSVKNRFYAIERAKKYNTITASTLSSSPNKLVGLKEGHTANAPLKYGLISENSHPVAYAFDMGPQMMYTSAYPSNVIVPLNNNNNGNNNSMNYMDRSPLAGYNNNNLPPLYQQPKNGKSASVGGAGMSANGSYPDYINSSISHIPHQQQQQQQQQQKIHGLQMDNMHSANMAAFGEGYQLYVPQYHGGSGPATAGASVPYYYQQPRPPHLSINTNSSSSTHAGQMNNHQQQAMMYAQQQQHNGNVKAASGVGYAEDDIFEKFRPPTLRISK